MRRSFLEIKVEYGRGHSTSWSRSQNVGVGGKNLFCSIAPGEPVRRATQSELRRMDRERLARMVADYPDGKISFRRWRTR